MYKLGDLLEDEPLFDTGYGTTISFRFGVDCGALSILSPQLPACHLKHKAANVALLSKSIDPQALLCSWILMLSFNTIYKSTILNSRLEISNVTHSGQSFFAYTHH
uniref:Uncharacterized protein n=1 Tax=Bionectria ochroleuca TaxID=29856 RepID=A0A8H7N2N9_BIOOC